MAHVLSYAAQSVIAFSHETGDMPITLAVQMSFHRDDFEKAVRQIDAIASHAAPLPNEKEFAALAETVADYYALSQAARLQAKVQVSAMPTDDLETLARTYDTWGAVQNADFFKVAAKADEMLAGMGAGDKRNYRDFLKGSKRSAGIWKDFSGIFFKVAGQVKNPDMLRA